MRQRGGSRLRILRNEAQTAGIATDLDFNLSTLYHNWGKGYERRGQYADAIRIFEQALHLSQDKAGTREALGDIYLDVGSNNTSSPATQSTISSHSSAAIPASSFASCTIVRPLSGLCASTISAQVSSARCRRAPCR